MFCIFQTGAGDYVGLDLMLAPEAEHYVSYTRAYYGLSLVVHFSKDFVDMPSNIAIVQPGYFVKALVTPSILVTDQAVRTLPLQQRKCLFPDENIPKQQSEYRHVSCMTECRMQGILQRCNCIPFYYPHISEFAVRGESPEWDELFMEFVLLQQVLRHFRNIDNARFEILNACAIRAAQ